MRKTKVCAAALVVAAWGARNGLATPSVQQLSDSHGNYFLVNNGAISFQLYSTGSLAGKITSIVYDSQQMLGGKDIYYDIQGSPGIYLGASQTYSVAGVGSNFVDITAKNNWSPTAGLDVTWHWILVDGQPGFSQYLTYHHTTAMPDYYTNENRLGAEFFNGSLFHYSSITDNFWGYQDAGVTLRDQGRFITAETSDVRGVPGEYAKNYETKYDWRSTYQQSGGVTGIFGQPNTTASTKGLTSGASNYGAWNLVSQREYESWNAGPTHPQTPVADGASIIPSPPGSHFGGPGVLLTGNVDKAYGPFLTYFNKGATIGDLRSDAKAQLANIDALYDSLTTNAPGGGTMPYLNGSNYYQSGSSRAAVSGKIRLGDGTGLEGATVILSAFDAGKYAYNPIGQEYQRRAANYNYWVTPNADGTFTIPDVRQGNYRLTIIKPGSYREGTWDNISVRGTGTLNVGNLTWSPDIYGKGVFQVGTFDRTAGEFHDGKSYNNWLGTFDEAKVFAGGVNLKIDPANPFNDTANWRQNWPLYQENGTVDFFHINFPLASVPAAGSVLSFTVAVAAEEFINSLGLAFNGNGNQIYASFDHEADNAPSVYRSGDTTSQVLYRKVNVTVGASGSLGTLGSIVAGNNDLRLHIVGGNMQYDAIRLDIIPPGAFSLAQFNGGTGLWSDASQWSTQKYGYTALNKGQATLADGTANTDYTSGGDSSTTFADGAAAVAPVNAGTNSFDAVVNGGVVTVGTSVGVQKLSLLQGTVIASGTTLTANDAFVLAGATVTGTGTISAASTTFVSFTNAITGGMTVSSGGAVSVADGAMVTISGPGSRWVLVGTTGLGFGTGGATGITVAGGGTLSVAAGAIVVGAYGNVSTEAGSSLVAGSVTNAGSFTAGGPVAVSGTFSNSGHASLGGGLSGGTVVNTGGVLMLGGSNTYTGPTVISGGAVVFGSAGAIGGSGASVQVGPGGAAAHVAGVTDPAFLGRIAPGSGGALALLPGDAATDLDFTAGALVGVGGMGVGAVGSVTYTGALTPAGGVNGVYRLGGGGGALTYVPVIGGSASVQIGNVGSSGAVVLAGMNTYTGPTVIKGGTLSLGALPAGGVAGPTGASDAGAANLVLDGGTLQYVGGVAAGTDRLMTLGAGGGVLESAGAGGVSFTATGSTVASGAGNRTLVLGGVGNGYLAAGLADPGAGVTSLTKVGSGTWVLGAGARTYSGDTTVLAGQLKLGAGAGLPSGKGAAVVETGASLDLGGQSVSVGALNDGPVDPSGRLDPLNPNTPAGWATPNGPGGGAVANSGGGATLTVGAGNGSGLFSGIISGNTALVKVGSGTQVLSGDNVNTGTTTISGGILQIGNGGTPLSYGPGDGGFTGKLGSGGIVNNATLVFNRGYFTTATNVISGTGTLKQIANATLVVGGANTYTGPTLIGGGIANIGQGGPSDGAGLAYSGDCAIETSVLANGGVASGVGASSASAANLVLDGGTLYYDSASAASTNRLFTVTQNGGAIFTHGALTFSGTGAVTFSGSGDRTLSLGGDSTSGSTFAPAITDPAAGGETTLTKDRSAMWTITSPSSTYSGDTFIRAGTLRMGVSNALPFGPGKGNLTFGTDTDFNIAFDPTLDLNGFDTGVNGISGGQLGQSYWTITNSSGTTRTLTFGNGNASGDYLGNIAGNVNLVKVGSGLQTFEGTNSNTGATTVNGGGLIFAATATIGGTGKNITVNNGALLGAPGNFLNQAFLARIAAASTGAVAMTSSSTNALDFSATGASLPNLSLGAVGMVTYSGALTPYGNVYRFGGGGGVMTVSSNLTGAGSSLAAGTNGTFILTGTNGYGGSTTVGDAAIVEFATPGAGSSGTAANITLVNGGTIGVGYGLDQTFLNRIAAASSGVVAMGTSSFQSLNFSSPGLSGVSLGAIGTQAFSGTITPAGNTYRLGGGGGQLTISSSAALGGSNGVAVIGPGRVVLSAGEAYGGPVTIGPGATLQASVANGGASSGLGVSSNAASNLILNGGTLVGVGSTDRQFTLAASSTLDNTQAFSIGDSGGGGSISMAAGASLTLTLTGTNTGHNYLYLQAADPAGGQLAILKSGAGKWSFSKGVKTYSGDTHVTGGTLETISANALSAKSSLILDAGTTLDLHANSQVINGLSGSGAVVDSFGTSQTFTIGSNNGGGAFSGAIGGPVSIIKGGTGAQYLTGTNSYANATTINAGALVFGGVAGVGGTGTSVTVAASGTVASLSGTADPAFLARIAPASPGVLALTAADGAAALNFAANPLASLSNAYVGALGSVTYSGVITTGAAPTALRFGGGGGTLVLASNIGGTRGLAVGPAGIPASGVVVLAGTNTFSGGVTVQSGELRVASAAGLPAVGLSVSTGARLSLAVNPLTPAGDKVLTPTSLTVAGAVHGGAVAPTGAIDLGNNDAIIPGPAFSEVEVRQLLAAGYASGTWGGNGISSSAAAATSGLTGLGYLPAATYAEITGGAAFDGLTPAAGSTLVRYTYVGDTDFGGTVDASDLANLLAGMSGGLSGWANGDVNYDGVVNAADLGSLLNALRYQGAPLGGAGAGGGSVPEAGVVGVLVLPAMALARRRRR